MNRSLPVLDSQKSFVYHFRADSGCICLRIDSRRGCKSVLNFCNIGLTVAPCQLLFNKTQEFSYRKNIFLFLVWCLYHWAFSTSYLGGLCGGYVTPHFMLHIIFKSFESSKASKTSEALKTQLTLNFFPSKAFNILLNFSLWHHPRTAPTIRKIAKPRKKRSEFRVSFFKLYHRITFVKSLTLEVEQCLSTIKFIKFFCFQSFSVPKWKTETKRNWKTLSRERLVYRKLFQFESGWRKSFYLKYHNEFSIKHSEMYISLTNLSTS